MAKETGRFKKKYKTNHIIVFKSKLNRLIFARKNLI